jgi:hypothetical protein
VTFGVGAAALPCVAGRMALHNASMTHRFQRHVRGALTLLGVSWLAMAMPVQAAPQAALDDTADCIAVMQGHADEIARQVKAGDEARKPALKTELRRAGALIGRTYLDGLHDGDEAKARLKAAQERQRSWDDGRKSSVHAACLQRADAEITAASGLERFFVERFAQARLQRMLAQ